MFSLKGDHYPDEGGGVVIVGEGPGTQEVREGKPFVGPAGAFLNKCLERALIDPHSLWITNATLCPPDGIVAGKTKEEVLARAAFYCRERLMREIDEARPSVVVTLGAIATASVAGERVQSGEAKLRIPPMLGRYGRAGVVSEVRHGKGAFFHLSTIHPAFILRSRFGGRLKGGDYEETLVQHLTKARTVHVERGHVVVDYEVSNQPDRVAAFFSEHPGPFAFDVETDSPDPWRASLIDCIGFASIPTKKAIVIPTLSPTSELLDVLQDVLEGPALKVGHNVLFDMLVIRRLWGIEVQNVEDTLVLNHALNPDDDQSLAWIVNKYASMPDWKRWLDEARRFGNVSLFYKYNAHDCVATAIAYENLDRAVREKGLRDVSDVDHALLDVAFRMSLFGVPVSSDRVRTLRSRAQKQMLEALDRLRSLSGEPSLNPRSERIREILFEKEGPFKLPVIDRTETGKPSITKETLQRFRGNPLVDAFLAYRDAAHVIEHFCDSDAMKPLADGRVHPFWKPYGTATGRWSSEPNFQNIPKRSDDDMWNVRHVVVAPPGRAFVGADYDQLELRIMASLSGDRDFIQRCMAADEKEKTNPSKDPHAFVAWRVFGEKYEAADSDRKKRMRNVAKRVVYGLNYGASAPVIYRALVESGEGDGLDIATVTLFVEKYFEVFPSIAQWVQRQLDTAHRERCVVSPISGRKRWFNGAFVPTIALNFPIQSSAADIVNDRMLIIHDEIAKIDPTAYMFAQVHDAVFIECDASRADEVKAFIDRVLPVRLDLSGCGVPMLFSASASIGTSWDEV